MTDKNFTWEIESVHPAISSMVVKYSIGEASISINIPIPSVGEDLAEQISRRAPHVIQSRDEIQQSFHPDARPGLAGDVVTSVHGARSEPPQMAGDWQEEYLRAVIYQVLQEIKESEV